jgi:hypothetical protein
MDTMSASECSSSDDECMLETIEQLRYKLLHNNIKNDQRISMNSNNSNSNSTTDALHKRSKEMYDSWCRPDTTMSTSLNNNFFNSSNRSVSNSAAASVSQQSITSSTYSKSQRSISAGPTNRIKFLSQNVINPTRRVNNGDKLDSVLGTIDTLVQDALNDHQLQQSTDSSVSSKVSEQKNIRIEIQLDQLVKCLPTSNM